MSSKDKTEISDRGSVMQLTNRDVIVSDVTSRPGFFRIDLHHGFLLCLFLFSGFSCSVATVFAGEPIEIEFEASTRYNGEPVMLGARLFKPDDNGPYPAVILMHGCGGLQEPVRHALRAHAGYLVRHGYVALSLDSFGSREIGEGQVCKTFERLMNARRYRTADALDALAYLRSLDYVDSDNIFQMGQSNGGSVSIRLAQLDVPAFRATAAFYPWCGTFNRLGSQARLTSPLIILAGALDDWTPPADCLTVRSSAADYKVVVYPGAVHSFDLEIPKQEYQGHSVGYDRSAATDSRLQMLAFFSSHLTAEMRASMPVPVQNETSTESYLTGAQIRQLMPSGKLRGINAYGNPYTVSYTPGGDMSGVAGKSDEYSDVGKWWVTDDTFCRQYESWLEGKASCFMVSLKGNDIRFFETAGNLVSSGTFGE